MGIGFLIQVSTTNPYVTNGVNFTLPYLSLSLALNIVCTMAIVLRLLAFRYRTVAALGPKYGTQYTSIAAMIIESAAIYSAVSITFLVLFGINNSASQVFIQSLSQFQVRFAFNNLTICFSPRTIDDRHATYRFPCRAGQRLDGGYPHVCDESEVGSFRYGEDAVCLAWRLRHVGELWRSGKEYYEWGVPKSFAGLKQRPRMSARLSVGALSNPTKWAKSRAPSSLSVLFSIFMLYEVTRDDNRDFTPHFSDCWDCILSPPYLAGCEA